MFQYGNWVQNEIWKKKQKKNIEIELALIQAFGFGSHLYSTLKNSIKFNSVLI